MSTVPPSARGLGQARPWWRGQATSKCGGSQSLQSFRRPAALSR